MFICCSISGRSIGGSVQVNDTQALVVGEDEAAEVVVAAVVGRTRESDQNVIRESNHFFVVTPLCTTNLKMVTHLLIK